jgi:hypothetical protein
MSIFDSNRIREILDYNPDTGDFHWKIKPTKNTPIGKKAGGVTNEGYGHICYKGKRYSMSHLAWMYFYGKPPSMYLDHINGNRFDNRISNLREATSAENMQNIRKAPKNSSHGFLGTSFDSEKNKWRARIRVNGVKISLGRFNTPQEANAAYIAAKRKHHPFNTL